MTARAANEWGSTWQATKGGEDTWKGTAGLGQGEGGGGGGSSGGGGRSAILDLLIKGRCDQRASA